LRALLLLVLLVCACPPPAERPYPPPTPEALIAHLRSRARGLFALRAQAKADYLDGRDRVKISLAVLAARPDRLRLAGESALTGPLLTLATDGRDFQLLDVRRNRFLAGPVTPCAIAELTRVELSPREAVEVLFGGVLVIEPVRARVSFSPEDGGREVLTLEDARGRTEVVRLSSTGRTWDVREAELRDPAGRPVWRLRHEGFAEHPLPGGQALRLPATTYIEDPPNRSDVRLRWRERELNPTLPEGAFRLEAPPGVPIETSVCSSLGRTSSGRIEDRGEVRP
jgi:hypothetical protein